MRIFVMFALPLGIAWLLPTTSDAYQPSGCEVCASTGKCSHAFKGGEGQYCGTWHDVLASAKRPCCCPLNTYCKVSQFECRCHVPDPASASHGQSPEPYYYHAPTHQNSDPYWFVRFIFWIVFILCCCCCCCLPGLCSRKKTHGNSGGSDPSVYPMYSNWGSTFGSAPEAIPVAVPYGNPPSMNPEYTAGNTYGSTDHRRGGGGGRLGTALGGLAVGTAVGSMIGGRRSDGYFGGGGGHHHGAGYDIAGDSGKRHGDGGYDIAGDS